MEYPSSLGVLATLSKSARAAWVSLGRPAMAPEEIMEAARQRVGNGHPSVRAVREALETVHRDVRALRVQRPTWELVGIDGAEIAYRVLVRLPHAVVWIGVKPMWSRITAVFAPVDVGAADFQDAVREMLDVNGVLSNDALRRRLPRALVLSAGTQGARIWANVIVTDRAAVQDFAATAWAVLRAWHPERAPVFPVDLDDVLIV